ncbi:class I SAM-dependent methyltransferase [Pseudarthrobacter phenanthrenivorans]|uniref:Class I SAM-dependent methyltransferase n=1 Tax=Pseudarthrobacter phenanthrenivorans TaxID=361575 RepID=A0A3B0EYD0_PSEPS|nr:class I SAM-dependent methyltransferase [Pseudarthrobacter phenanthrenivorans]RKO19786.1 class I SAM-dependent methyltransferase [Pseudarthrobacter phenanthrenivorans]TPV50598.1 class I SAM-dependent methyltransferase [Pseudarthrobacter phenanthrenivorans]
MSEHAANRHEAQHPESHLATHDGTSLADGPAAEGGAAGAATSVAAAAVWDERYRAKPQVWSGKPNPQLVREAGGLRPAKALDLGCGEGADAIWLAQQGWTVTAVDVSAVALERARSHEKAALARESVHAAEGTIGSRITWQQADLEQWQPGGTFELVTSQFLHSQELAWQGPLRTAAAAVKPGGTLLVVGHHPDRLPPWGSEHHHHKGMFYTADEVVRELGLDSPEWQLEVQTSRERPVTGPDGQQATIADVVVRATRLP